MSIAEQLCKNLDLKEINKSKSGSLLIFSKNYTAEKFEDFFGIKRNINFEEAFNVVTSGPGKEIKKINSVHSSSLLSLLFFYPLYNNDSKDVFIQFHDNEELKDIRFTKCLFEVRNRVICKPSCIDVVLISEDEKTLLYLESKLGEYLTVDTEKIFGKGYLELYKALNKERILTPIVLDEKNDKKTVLRCDTPCYIDGIKQSISHLIGLIKGPTNEKVQNPKADDYVLKEYEYYRRLYNQRDNRIFYNTIIYNPQVLNLTEETTRFKNYVSLYKTIIGERGNDIMRIIKKKFKCSGENKTITVMKTPLTYNEVFGEYLSSSYISILENTKIKTFYSL